MCSSAFFPVGIILSIVSAIPLINLALIPSLASEATLWLRPVFGRISFWGVTNQMLLDADNRHCAECGYDLSGLAAGICPECAHPFQLR